MKALPEISGGPKAVFWGYVAKSSKRALGISKSRLKLRKNLSAFSNQCCQYLVIGEVLQDFMNYKGPNDELPALSERFGVLTRADIFDSLRECFLRYTQQKEHPVDIRDVAQFEAYLSGIRPTYCKEPYEPKAFRRQARHMSLQTEFSKAAKVLCEADRICAKDFGRILLEVDEKFSEALIWV